MESMGAFPEGEWDFYNRIFSMEEPDFAVELLGQCSFPEGSQATYPSTIYQNHPETTYDTMVEAASGSLFHINPSSCHEPYFSSDQFNYATNDLSSMDFSIMDEKATTSTLFSQLLADIPMGDTTTYTIDHPHDPQPEPKTNQPNQARKRPRVAIDVEKKKRNVRPKKGSKLKTSPTPPNHEDLLQEDNGGVLIEGQSLSNYSSEDENGSHDSNGGASSESKASHEALNPSSGKARASRGSATDPQSLYARKRRERINERLRILQTLVPNGTKVDISTMLEEAVHYVKFLQLQIKLLSSDDHWMFAPIAYNGIDIGLNQKISMLL